MRQRELCVDYSWRPTNPAWAAPSTNSLEPMSSPTSARSSGRASMWPPAMGYQANSRHPIASCRRPSSSRPIPSWCLCEAPWESSPTSQQASVWRSGERPLPWLPSPGCQWFFEATAAQLTTPARTWRASPKSGKTIVGLAEIVRLFKFDRTSRCIVSDSAVNGRAPIGSSS